mgnify:CR=1 FL=1
METKLKEVTDKIVKEFEPEKIILFGSYAWGNPHEDSDLDFFIVKDTDLSPLKRIEAVDRIFSRRDLPMDFLVYTPKQVEENLKRGDFFVRDIITKGKVLYDTAAKR